MCLAKIPPLPKEYVRQVCAGVNQLNLASDYLQHMKDKRKRWIFRSSVRPCPKDLYLVQCPSFASQMEISKTYIVYLLFDKVSLVDSMCTCNNIARSIPCAHRGTVLVALSRKQNNISLIPKETASVKQRSHIIIPDPDFEGGWKDLQAANEK